MGLFGQSGTIYDAPPAQPFTFEVGDPDLNEQLGFPAAAIIVTNPTDQVLFLPDGPELVPPGTFGKIVPIRNTELARASWTVPALYRVVQRTPSKGGAAQLQFLHGLIDAPPHPGVAAFVVAKDAGDDELGELAVPLGGSQSIQVSRPTGTYFLRVNIVSGSLLQLTVVGDQSGTIYLDVTGSAPNQLAGVFGCGISEAIETSVTISGVAAAMSEATLRVSAQFSAENIAPPPWRVPNQPPVFHQRIGIGTDPLVAGFAGKLIYLFGVELDVVVAAVGSAGVLQDSSGNNLATIRGAAVGQVDVGFAGAPIANVGDGLQLTVAGGAATVQAMVKYSQSGLQRPLEL